MRQLRAMAPIEAAALKGHIAARAVHRDAKRFDAAESGLAVGSARVIVDGAGPIGDRGEHRVPVRDRLVSRQRHDSVHGARRGYLFIHANFPV